MGEKDSVTEDAEASANGTTPSGQMGAAVTEDKEKEKDGVKEMEEDSKNGEKVGTEEMDVDKEEVEASKGTKEEKAKQLKELKEEDEKELKEMKEEDEKELKEMKEVEEEKEEPKSEASEEEIGVNVNEENGDKVEKNDGSMKEEGTQEESKEEKVMKKHMKKKSAGEKVNNKKKEVKEKKDQEKKTPVASAIERPVRQRKSVERLVASIEKETVKEFRIEKGIGTALKDIPNVAYKLSKGKTDDIFKLLHTILFGRRGKAFQIRTNISRFSGFAWHENEDKQKMKVKEKFDKCVKEKLLEFCDFLDIPIAKTTTRKEDIVTKLIDFLMAPHATTTQLLAEKEQSSKGKKRKSVGEKDEVISGSTSSGRSAKSRKRIESAFKGEEKKSTLETEDELDDEEEQDEEYEAEENLNGVRGKSEDETPEHAESEEKENESEDESEEDTKKHKSQLKNSSSKKGSTRKAKSNKVTIPKQSSPQPKRIPRKSSNRSKVDVDSNTSPKIFSRKKKNEVVKEKSSTPKKSASKEKAGKKVLKGKDKPKENKLRPSDDKLRDAISEILKEVDFNTATFTDILKQLAKRFNTDLTPRKSSIKLMIQNELTRLADEAEEEEDEGDAEKDDVQPSGQGVKA